MDKKQYFDLEKDANDKIQRLKDSGYKNQYQYERKQNFRKACLEYDRYLSNGGY